MTTPVEFIGVGPLAAGEEAVSGGDHPRPYAPAEPMGQHLSVERLVRVAPDRLVYFVTNKTRKWQRKKCWACGNKYSPNTAQCCTYCNRPLEDARFLMTARWDSDLYPGFEELAKARVKHDTVLSPVYAFYRERQMLAVYHYDGGAFLLDVVAPLPGKLVLGMFIRLAESLGALHERGLVLKPFGSHQIVVMPDHSPRWFDLDLDHIDPRGAKGILTDPAQPALRDARNLAEVIRPFVAPEDDEIQALVDEAVRGVYPGPIPLSQAARRLLWQRMRPDARLVHTLSAAMSDLGLRRANNEDTWAWRKVTDTGSVYVVADGMGGHARGEVASDLASRAFVDTVRSSWPQGKAGAQQYRELMEEAMNRANRAVFDRRKADRLEMGTTVTALLIVDRQYAFVSHAGDTRCYHVHKGTMKQVTKDQTVAADLLADGLITAEQAKKHPGQHILTVTVGGEAKLEDQELHQIHAAQGDRFLLCTDGLYDVLSADQIREALTHWADRQKAVLELVRAAVRAGTGDNVTVLVVDVE